MALDSQRIRNVVDAAQLDVRRARVRVRDSGSVMTTVVIRVSYFFPDANVCFRVQTPYSCFVKVRFRVKICTIFENERLWESNPRAFGFWLNTLAR